MSRINYVDGLAIEREQILLKIYLTKTDIRNFLRCGCPEASAIYEQAISKLCENKVKIYRAKHITKIFSRLSELTRKMFIAWQKLKLKEMDIKKMRQV